MAISIRKVRKLNQVVLLDAQVFDYEQDSPVAIDGVHWWVAFDKDTPVAYAGIKPVNEKVAFLCRAGVLPSHRGKGLQTKLIRTRLAWAKKHGFKQVITYTVVDNPVSSNNLIRCGFKLYVPEWKWVGSEALYWTRTL